MQKFVPIDFHCHGIGRFDFAEPSCLLLDELEHHLQIEGSAAILTLYLPKSHLTNFAEFVAEFDRGRKNNQYGQILGIALEGPLLASFGGTPERGCWPPTLEEWKFLARLGSQGLTYIVISPNANFPTEPGYPTSILEVVDILLDHGVTPALGHFGKADPERSAEAIKTVCEHVMARGSGPLFTDHLFNDMPVKFKYNWRTASEKSERRATTPDILKSRWTESNVVDVLGPVPAALIEYAKQGALKICLNFDGDHVDLEVCKQTIEFVGSDNLMMMTDRIQSEILAGQRLRRSGDNTLLYQSAGIVAGGTQSVMRQIGNLLAIGVPSDDVLKIVHNTAARALGKFEAAPASVSGTVVEFASV